MATGAPSTHNPVHRHQAHLSSLTLLSLSLSLSLQAGDALLRSGDCYSRHTELQFEASNRYQEAGTAFKQEDVSLAVRALRRAAAISTDVEDAVNFQRAARLYRDVGDMLEASGNTTAAEEEYGDDTPLTSPL